MVGSLSNSKDVRRDLVPPLSSVHSNSSQGVDGEPLVRVHCNAEEARVGVNEPLNIALLQVKQHRGIIEISQVRHVLTAIILRRVDLIFLSD